MRNGTTQAPPPALHRIPALKPRPVLRNRNFLLLWLAQIISQSAQNAILFTLLVLVTTLSHSSTYTSVLVLAFVIPSLVFGVFSGVIVDVWSKRLLLVYANVARGILAVMFLLSRDHVAGLILISVFFSTANQTFATSDAASVPFVVKKDELIAANSMFALAVTGSQLIGMIFLGPVLVPTVGSAGVFILATVMFALAVTSAWFLPPLESVTEPGERTFPTFGELRHAAGEYFETLRTLREDKVARLALVHYATGSSLVLLFAVLVPRYMQTVLEVAPDKAVTIFAPVGVGAILGLRSLPYIVGRLGKNRTVIVGLLGVALALVALGMIEPLSVLMQRTSHLDPFKGSRVGGLSILVLLTMAFAGPLGFTYALVNAPAQTVLHERAPIEMRGRVFAAQVVLANGVGILPLIAAGSVADIFGVTPVLFAIAFVMTAVASVSVYYEVQWSRSGGDHAGAGGTPL